MKPLPPGVCRKLPKPVPTCCPLRVEQLPFLSRRNPTVGSPTILERRKTLSLSLKIKTKPSASHSFSPTFSLGFFFCFIPFFCSSFFFSFLFSSSFIFSQFPPSFLNFSPLFGALTVWVQRRKFPPLLPQVNCVAIPFPSLFLLFLNSSL